MVAFSLLALAQWIGAQTGAVVKADAYGCGIGRVGPALRAAGCRTFFVAHLSEGIAARAFAPAAAAKQLVPPPPLPAPLPSRLAALRRRWWRRAPCSRRP